MTEGTSRPGDPSAPRGVAGEPPVYPPAPPVEPVAPGVYETTGSQGGTKQAAKDEAKNVAGSAQGAAQDVKESAKAGAQETAHEVKEQASQTMTEAKNQARDLYEQTRGELSDQASSQQERLAGGLRSLSGELHQMAEGSQEQGMATDLARQAAGYLDRAGSWLGDRQPGDVIDEVARYARRHPGTFTAVAAGLGLLVGRVARGLKDAGSDESSGESSGARHVAGTGYRPDTGSRSYTVPGAGDSGVVREYPPAFGTPTGTGTAGTSGPGTSGTTTGTVPPPILPDEPTDPTRRGSTGGPL